MKALKNFSYRRRSNFDFPHHLQWESSAPQLSYDTNGTAAQKGSSPSFRLRKTDCRTGNEHGHKSKKKTTKTKSWGVPYSPSALLD